MAAGDLNFKVNLDTSDFLPALNRMTSELEGMGDAFQKVMKDATNDRYEVDVTFNADTSDYEVALRATSALEQKIEAQKRKDQRERDNEEKRQAKDREKELKNKQKLNDDLAKKIQKFQKDQQKEQDKYNRQLVEEFNKRMSIANNWSKVLQAGRDYAAIQKGSLTWVNQQLSIETEKLNQLKRGTQEYENQLAIVKQLQGQRKIEILGNQGVQAEAFNALAEGFSKVVFIGQQVAQVMGAITGSIEALTVSAAKLQSLELTFQAIGVGASGANVALQESRRIALGLGVDIISVREAYQKLTPVILATGGSMTNVSAVTESLASRFAAFGKSAEESRRIMNGVIQAFGKGKLQAEELTQQISEADPAFKTDLANAIGVTVAKLEDMVKNSELTSERLLQVLPLLSKSSLLYGKLGETASSAVAALAEGNVTLEQVRTQINNLNQLNLEAFGQAFIPILGSLLSVQAAFTDFFTAVSQSTTFEFLVNVFTNISNAIAGTTSAVLYVAQGFIQIADVVGGFLNSLDKAIPISEALAFVLTAVGLALAKVAISAAAAQFAAFAASIAPIVLQMKGLVVSTFAAGGGFATLSAGISTAGMGISAFIVKIGSMIAALVVKTASLFTAAGATGVLTAALNFASGAVGLFLTTLGPFLVPLLAIAGVVAGIKYAWDQHNKTLAESKKVTEETDKAIEKMNEDVSKAGNGLQAYTTQQERAEKAGMGLLQYYNKNIETSKAIEQSTTKFTKALDGNIAALEKSVKAAGDDEEAQRRNENTAKAMTAAIDGQIQSRRQQLAQLQGIINAGGELNQGEQKLYESLKQSVVALEAKRDKLQQIVPAANAAGNATDDYKEKIDLLKEALDGLKEKIQEEFAAQKDAAKETFEAAKEALNDQKEAQRSQHEERLAQLEGEKNKSKEMFDLMKAGIKAARDYSKLRHDEALKQIELEKKKVEERYAKEQERIAALTQAENTRHTTKMAQLNAEIASNETLFNGKLSQIQQEIAALDQAASAKIAALEAEKQAVDDRAAKQAEEKRKEEELAALRLQAATAESAEDRKAAQEKLAAIEAEKVAEAARAAEKAAIDAKIEEERKKAEEERAKKQKEAALLEQQLAQNLAAIKQQIALEEKANTDELAALKKEADEAEATRKSELADFEKAIAKEKEAQKQREAAFDRQEEQVRLQAKEAERTIEEKIAAEKKEWKKAQAAFDKAQRELEKKHKEETKKLEEAEKKRLKEIESQKKRLSELEKDRKTEHKEYLGQLDTEEQTLKRIIALENSRKSKGKGKFAGGPVTGGTTYTVNELGQEGFLSRSGVLSMINAPAFGQWKAPGAGTVVPAHVMAGLDIPRKGVPVNAVASSRGSDGSGSMLGALRGLMMGGTSRVTNNVTIQSQAPVTDASKMMVEMSKLRLRRK